MLYRYSRWDGTQQVFPFDADDIMDALSEDMMNDSYNDLMNALQRLSRNGFNNQMGERITGMQELLNRLRQQRQAQMNRYDLDSVMQDIREKLEEVVKTERQGLQKRLDDTANSDQKELRNMLEKQVQKKQQYLDKLPQDPGQQIRQLNDYEFMDNEARQKFQELMQQVQQQMMGTYFQGMKQAMENNTPEQMQQTREMIKELNQMLQDKAQGKQPKFQQFMQKYGQYFPPGINSLDDLIKHLQEQMAKMQSLMNSMSPEQRRQLESMMNAMLKDEGMRQELSQLANNLEQLYPMRGSMGQRYPFQGDENLGLSEAMDLMSQLQDMDNLERDMRDVLNGNKSMADLDQDKIQQLMGDDASAQLDQLNELGRMLEEAGFIEKKRNGKYELTPRGMRKIGQKALKDIFGQLKKDSFGKHKTNLIGNGGERTDIAKKYEFGDPFMLDLEQTVMNAVFREGPATPVRLQPEDFEVYRTELVTSSATVLMVDMSYSMVINNYWGSAKKVAMALNQLIQSQYPRDSLYIIGFSSIAQRMTAESLNQVDWNDYEKGTNMHHGFMLARQLLGKHKSGNKQIIMITDGEPTAHLEEGGYPYFNWPPEPLTIQKTLLEVNRCTRDGIVINTFMLEQRRDLVRFVEDMTKINKGRAFYSSPENLGEYILVDYISNKKKRVK